MSVPAFDIPDGYVLQAQFWLTPMQWSTPPVTMGSARVSRDAERGEVLARVTHYTPDGTIEHVGLVDELRLAYPRLHGRAGDLVGLVLAAAAAKRGEGAYSETIDGAAWLPEQDLQALVAMARRAPVIAGERGDVERAVLERAERSLADRETARADHAEQ